MYLKGGKDKGVTLKVGCVLQVIIHLSSILGKKSYAYIRHLFTRAEKYLVHFLVMQIRNIAMFDTHLPVSIIFCLENPFYISTSTSVLDPNN